MSKNPTSYTKTFMCNRYLAEVLNITFAALIVTLKTEESLWKVRDLMCHGEQLSHMSRSDDPPPYTAAKNKKLPLSSNLTVLPSMQCLRHTFVSNNSLPEVITSLSQVQNPKPCHVMSFMMARRLSPTVIQSDFCDKVLFIELNLVVGLGGRNSVLWVTHPTVTLDSLLKAKVSITFFFELLGQVGFCRHFLSL